jgi:predicted N-acetyltransferase YhbS
MTVPPAEGILPLSAELVKAASVTRAQAFADDPTTAYLVPDADKRENLNYSFEYYLRLSLLSPGYEAYVTSPACEGVVIWVGPDANDSLLTQFRAGWPVLPLRLGWRSLFRETRMDARFSRIRQKLVPKRHMYLALLAVAPQYQGAGHAGRLVRPMLERLDREKMPAFVETQNERNAAMYGRWGFRLLQTEAIPGTDVKMHLMLREPAKP